jgi:hypothetical protein
LVRAFLYIDGDGLHLEIELLLLRSIAAAVVAAARACHRRAWSGQRWFEVERLRAGAAGGIIVREWTCMKALTVGRAGPINKAYLVLL